MGKDAAAKATEALAEQVSKLVGIMAKERDREVRVRR